MSTISCRAIAKFIMFCTVRLVPAWKWLAFKKLLLAYDIRTIKGRRKKKTAEFVEGLIGFWELLYKFEYRAAEARSGSYRNAIKFYFGNLILFQASKWINVDSCQQCMSQQLQTRLHVVTLEGFPSYDLLVWRILSKSSVAAKLIGRGQIVNKLLEAESRSCLALQSCISLATPDCFRMFAL